MKIALWAACAAVSCAGGVWGQCQEAKLTGPGVLAGDNFGRRVALSGNLIAVSAPLHDGPAGLDSGSVYVFRLEAGAWVFEQEVVPADNAAGDQYGFWIALDGDRLLVGAKFDDDLGADAGSAYVFRREGTSWVQETKLLPADGIAGDNFGNSVALRGDTAVIGSPTHDLPVSNGGAAYVFVRTGTAWAPQGKLTANDGLVNDQAGFTVALSANRALVGAWMADLPGQLDAGSAYVFVRSGTVWSQEAKLTAGDALAADRYAVGLTLTDDVAVVGSDLSDGLAASSGAAYVYRRTGSAWAQEQKIQPPIAPAGNASDQYGFSVATDGTTIVATAINAEPVGPVLNTGSAFIIQQTGGTWANLRQVTGNDSAAGDLFGSHVVFDAQRMVVGARQDDDGGIDAGTAFVFTLSECLCYPDCNGDGGLTVADFGCFQTRFVGNDFYADCNGDGQRTVADFGCYQTKFVGGCP